ncbi:glycosyltransferase family 4 protein [Mucilaginibacter sp. AW1-3]
MNKPKILFSIPTRHHVEIAMDELDGLRDLGYPCDSFPYAAKEGVSSKAGRMLVILKNAITLVKAARRFNPDIVYFNSRIEALAGFRDYLTIRLFKGFYPKKVKFIIKSHGSDLDVFLNSGRLTKLASDYLRKTISGWLFLSREEKSIADQKGYLPENKTFVTKNIVRAGHFKPDPGFKHKLNIPDECKVLLFVGRLIKEKGIFEVIEAFAKTNNKTQARLIVVGWGPEEENIKHRCNDLGISANVIFTGFIPETEVVAFYSNCDLLVFPTYFPEGFPMALFNSVAAGLGVITTKTRAAADFLTEPENCIWVDPKDSLNVCKAINLLVESPSLMMEMKTNNKQLGKLFTKEQVSLELASTINQIHQS